MSKYAKGTQQQLDAAKNDATLLPFDTVFIYNKYKMVRTVGLCDGVEHVKMCCVDNKLIWEYCCADDLLPANKDKKPKQKKWQNGTQADLDAAKDDARLIPKNTYFRAKYGELSNMIVYRIDSIGDDSADVLMYNFGVDRSQYMPATELEPIDE